MTAHIMELPWGDSNKTNKITVALGHAYGNFPELSDSKSNSEVHLLIIDPPLDWKSYEDLKR